MKRRYEAVDVVAATEGFAVMLDAKPLATPGKNPLVLASRVLALAIAAEWAAQGTEIVPASMPLTKLAATAIDRVTARRDDVIRGTAAYAASDLLCYRADAPDDLVARQARIWQPLLEWSAGRFDAPLISVTGIVAVPQPEASLNRLSAVLAGLDVMNLTAIADITGLTGSLILALALWDGRLDADAVADAAFLDDLFQAERWGVDEEASARLALIRAEITAAARFISLHRAGLS